MHVAIMIFVGFGFLMTFLKRYGFSAVSLTLLLGSFVYVWNMAAAAFWENVHHDDGFEHKTRLSLPLMVEGLFGGACVLISFGAVLGRVLPSQLMFFAFLEIIFYSANFWIGALELKATDSGGSMFVHLYGALFGVAAAGFLTPRGANKGQAHPMNSSRYSSDIFAMVGTTFLYIFWPSFNGGLAVGAGQLRAILNTTLSMAGSSVGTFFMCSILHHRKFDGVAVQNATLAGGVAIGTAANMAVNPSVVVLIGFGTGCISTLGFKYVSPFLESKFNIMDTCGVLNLHGIPGVIGALVGLFTVLGVDRDDDRYTDVSIILRKDDRDGADQAGTQAITILVTIGMAVVGGAITGFLTDRLFQSPNWPLEVYQDYATWEVPDDYTTVGKVSAATQDRRASAGAATQAMPLPSSKQPFTSSAAVPSSLDKPLEHGSEGKETEAAPTLV